MLAWTLIVASVLGTIEQENFSSLFETHEYRFTGGKYHHQLFRYRLFVPRGLKPTERYPLLVWLHGLGENGEDNQRNLAWLQLVLNYCKDIEKFRFFILVTQCPHTDPMWFHGSQESPDDMVAVTAEILRQTIRERPVDPNRVYLSGVSSGGSGCWEMAVVPLSSSGGDVSRVAKLKDIPIWAFHNLHDEMTSPAGVKDMVAAVERAGGAVHLTLLSAVGHDCWWAAFQKYEVLAWMLSQRRGAWIHWAPPGSRPWRVLPILPVPCLFLAIIWLAWYARRRLRAKSQPPSSEDIGNNANTEPPVPPVDPAEANPTE
jgi:predicted peptidase